MEDFSKLTKKELLERIKQQEDSLRQENELRSLTEHEVELEKIDRMADMTNPHKLPFSIKDDHKNIMLYTALNKRVGPLHPENAKQTMRRWKRAGHQLYTTPRTEAQVETYKQTDKYKIEHEKHLQKRKSRHAQSEKGRADKMITEIARVTAEAVAGKK